MSLEPSKVKVSVLMSVYNGERYLREALESILEQSWRDFEFIVVNDGSSDGTAAILASYNDPRLIILDNKGNQGLTRSLNVGLERARGEYVARQDADDLSLSHRLNAQVRFLDARPEISAVGSSYVEVDASGRRKRQVRMPKDELTLTWHSLFQNPFIHSTVMFRRAPVMALGAYVLMSEAQDYELWSRLLWSGHRLVNLGEALVRWRLNPQGVSGTFAASQGANFRAIVRTNLLKLTPALGNSEGRTDLVWRLQVCAGFDAPLDQVERALRALEDLVTNFCGYFQLDARQQRKVREMADCRTAQTLLHNAQQLAYAGRESEANEFARLALSLDKGLAFSIGYRKLRMKNLLGQQSTRRLRDAQKRIKSAIHPS